MTNMTKADILPDRNRKRQCQKGDQLWKSRILGYAAFAGTVYGVGFFVWLGKDQCQSRASCHYALGRPCDHHTYVFPQGKVAELFYVPDFDDHPVVCSGVACYTRYHDQTILQYIELHHFAWDFWNDDIDAQKKYYERVEPKVSYIDKEKNFAKKDNQHQRCYFKKTDF